MEKFLSQQEALRTAFTQVLGAVPVRGKLVITDEQRQQVGSIMMAWLSEARWSIRPGTRAAENPLNYIVGRSPTCLIEAWVQPRQQKGSATANGVEPGSSKMDDIKRALDAGIITQEQAQLAALKLLDL